MKHNTYNIIKSGRVGFFRRFFLRLSSIEKPTLIYIVSSLIIITILLSPILFSHGLPFSQDWSWPFFDSRKYFIDAFLAKDSILSFLGKYSYIPFIAVSFAGIGPVIEFKLFMIAIHFIAWISFFMLSRRFVGKKYDLISFIVGLTYSFMPYVFIRTITGFMFSLIAYAFLPLFINIFLFTKAKKIQHYLTLGLLLSMVFSQTQAGLLLILLITIFSFFSLLSRNYQPVKDYFFTLVAYFVVNIPWIIYCYPRSSSIAPPSGVAVTTLARMANMPHGLKRFLMSSDFEYTSSYFISLVKNRFYFIGWLLIWAIACFAILNKKYRLFTLSLLASCSLLIILFKGPAGSFGKIYLWVYHHFPQIMVFRDTYHFEFLIAFVLCVTLALGLHQLFQKIDGYKNIKKKWYRVIPKIILLGGVLLFIIRPYLSFDYAGYFKLVDIPPEYQQLYKYLHNSQNVCSKIYYPPGLDYIYLRYDEKNYNNSDPLANSMAIPYLHGGTSILNTPSQEMFYQNEVVSQFYEDNDNGEFVTLLNEGNIDCVVVRQDIDTKYGLAMNLIGDNDPQITRRWSQNNWLTMTKSKKGLTEIKSFGNNIYIFKPTKDISVITNNKIDQLPTPFTLRPTTYLPLTDWADINSYYKDGWTRGRYSFWRKLIFAQLRQDFIYTTKQNDVLTGKINRTGDYELWVRYLTGGTAGEVELRMNNEKFVIQKDSGEERLVWKKVGDIKLNGETNVEIKNIAGENAIADITLIQP